MSISLQNFQLHKSEVTPEGCEDAFAISENGLEIRIAVSDGASESYKSRLWAQVLVTTYVTNPLQLQDQSSAVFDSQLQCRDAVNVLVADDEPTVDVQLRAWLEDPCNIYNSSIDWKNLPWNQERAALRGDAATLLGLTLNTEEAVWDGVGIGDTNLFWLRENKLQLAFPISSADEFDSTPQLLSTLVDFNNELNIKIYRGEYQSGDVFVLATDALAWWILHQIEIGIEPWVGILNINQERFENFVHDLRSAGAIRDDDTTLIIVEI